MWAWCHDDVTYKVSLRSIRPFVISWQSKVAPLLNHTFAHLSNVDEFSQNSVKFQYCQLLTERGQVYLYTTLETQTFESTVFG